MTDAKGLTLGTLTAILLLNGPIFSMLGNPGVGAVNLGSYQINFVSVVGSLSGIALGLLGLFGLMPRAHDSRKHLCPSRRNRSSLATRSDQAPRGRASPTWPCWPSWPASCSCRSRWSPAGWSSAHLGSSIYGWTSVIGVLLAGLSLGNFLGGKIADFVKNEKQASWLFLASSVVTLIVIPMDNQPEFMAEMFFGGTHESILQQANTSRA